MAKRSHLLLGVAAAAAVLTTGASAATVNGTLKITITGTLSVAGTGYTAANCNALALLIPAIDNAATLSGAGLLSWLYSADQSANAHAAFGVMGIGGSTPGSSVTGVPPNPATGAVGSVSGFTCVITVPYTFTNATAAGTENIAIMYNASASDPGAYYPTFAPPKYPGGHTRQLMQVKLPPANGTVTNLSANVKL